MIKLSGQLANVLKGYSDSANNILSEARAWDICHSEFYKAVKKDDYRDTDNLALHLGMYLANWGMYRGSAFVRNYNYREYIPVIKTILDKKYGDLLDIDMTNYLDKNRGDYYIDLLMNLSGDLRKNFLPLRKQVMPDVKSDISQTLTTKILLVSLGCVPAYDQYFCKGITKEKMAVGIFGERSIRQLAMFYKNNSTELELCRNNLYNLENKQEKYPQAKLLDMLFFGIGYNN